MFNKDQVVYGVSPNYLHEVEKLGIEHLAQSNWEEHSVKDGLDRLREWFI